MCVLFVCTYCGSTVGQEGRLSELFSVDSGTQYSTEHDAAVV